jgi:4-hydroxyphenylpyruvate dioxygenase
MTPPPDAYYEMLEERLPGHGEPVEELKARGILARRQRPRRAAPAAADLLGNMIGPIFFEFIQRKKDEGFGEGNFKALFESMERDQLRRGALTSDDAA